MYGIALAFGENSQRERNTEINTPGNFNKCPKGAKEFSFYYVEKEEGKWFKCYARTEQKAYDKFKKFCEINNI